MQLKVERDNRKTVVHLSGALDGTGATRVVHALQRIHADSKGHTIVLDLSAIRKLEYFGITTLSRFIRSHGRQFQEIRLHGLQPSARNIFRRFGVES